MLHDHACLAVARWRSQRGARRVIALRRRLAAAAIALLLAGAVRADPGLFSELPLLLPPQLPEAAVADVALGDVSGDGRVDLIVVVGATTGTGGVQSGGRSRVYVNADGGFGGAGIELGSGLPETAFTSAVIADFDGDGRNDAIFAGGSLNGVAQATQIFRGAAGSPPLVPAGTLGSAEERTSIAAADFDNDGDRDLALARADGSVAILRNASTAGQFAFASIAGLAVSSSPAPRLKVAFGRFDADAFVDLAVLRAFWPGEPAGVLVFPNSGAAAPYAAREEFAMEAPIDVAVADVDEDGIEDLVVADRTFDPPGNALSASRVVYRRPGFVADEFRFPGVVAHTAVEVADVDNDGDLDIVFGQTPCRTDAPQCGAREVSSLAVWLQTATSWEPSPQCFGRHLNGPVGIAAGAIGFGSLPDFVAAGVRGAGSPTSGIATWRNNAGLLTARCCFAQTAAQYGEEATAAAPRASAASPQAPASVDLDAYAGVRDELMAGALNGQRLRDRYEQFSDELVALLRADLTLWSDAAAALTAWSGPVRALIDGDGASVAVTQAMVDAVDAFLVRIAADGSPALAQAIAEERALLPPFATFVGLDMNEFREIALPTDRIFASGFEQE